MRRKRKNNGTMEPYRDSNTYVLALFAEFEFLPINMLCFLDL